MLDELASLLEDYDTAALDLIEKQESELPGTEFQLPSNLDIAALVAAREESVSRVIADMKRQGLLGVNASGNWVLAVL